MAGAEARTVWQRTVNRCFVQEDAKRALCQSSSSTKQVEDSESFQAVIDHPHSQPSCSGFMPLHRNPNVPHLSPHNIRIWSHQHDIQVTKLMETQVNDQVLSEKRLELGAGDKQDELSDKRLSELSFEPSSPCNPLSCEKAEPWWRTTDKDELASLVAQRSLDYVDNCDLPTPKKMKCSYGLGDLSKSKLLEALRHSQTRAREAENMAKEAYAEKDHLVKLLFKQASELFGYKQLMQLLYLEAFYLQIKSKSKESRDSISWRNLKARKPMRKRGSKRRKMNASKYVVGLALGMSLVGAGLLLGWTVGWMQMLSF